MRICPREGKKGYNSYVCEIIIVLVVYIYMLIVFVS